MVRRGARRGPGPARSRGGRDARWAAGVGGVDDLGGVVSRWAATRGRGVLACWERPPELLLREFPSLRNAEVPDIVGWTIHELETWLVGMGVRGDMLVAIDYLQLVQGPEDVAAATAALAMRRGIRVVLGAMATRGVISAIEQALPPAGLLGAFAGDIDAMRGADRDHLERLVVVVDPGPDTERRLITSQPAPHFGMVETVA